MTPAAVLSLHDDHPYQNLFLLRQNIIPRNHIPPQQCRERVRFALFLKILFKRLKDSGEKDLFLKAQALVFFVTSKNRAGDPSYRPLMDSLERGLRRMVGEAHWRRAHILMRMYLERNVQVLPCS
jgi:hypothetical protein